MRGSRDGSREGAKFIVAYLGDALIDGLLSSGSRDFFDQFLGVQQLAAQAGVGPHTFLDTNNKYGVPLLAGRRRRGEDRYPVLVRSEEHTSELQSRGNIVCRLLH